MTANMTEISETANTTARDDLRPWARLFRRRFKAEQPSLTPAAVKHGDDINRHLENFTKSHGLQSPSMRAGAVATIDKFLEARGLANRRQCDAAL